MECAALKPPRFNGKSECKFHMSFMSAEHGSNRELSCYSHTSVQSSPNVLGRIKPFLPFSPGNTGEGRDGLWALMD